MDAVKDDIRDFIVMVSASFVILFLHELIGVMYTTTRGNPFLQAAIALLLPALKFFLRSIYAFYFRHKVEGFSTTLVVFEVEFFNVLYTSLFMQSATNLMVLLSLVVVDFIENVSFLYRMNRLGNELKKINERGTTTHLKLRRLLFRTELVVLVELVEVLTPLLFATFLLIQQNSSNLRFYPMQADMTAAELKELLLNLMSLSVIELLSLLALIGTLAWRFNLPLWSQIGFFITKNRGSILSTMIIWFVLRAVRLSSSLTKRLKSCNMLLPQGMATKLSAITWCCLSGR